MEIYPNGGDPDGADFFKKRNLADPFANSLSEKVYKRYLNTLGVRSYGLE